MNFKTTTYIFLAFIAILGWNAFLIKRDDEMFSKYKNRQQQVCEQMKSFHPDCHIE
jgi:hypothetical protein